MSQTEAGIRAKESINRLLLSAGYFRIRLPDLDDFDRIAGGLTWCLKASFVSVDVDIFYKEKPTMGEKVKISESICKGLESAKCPITLKPHQIQGLDYPSLFNVFQWLVKNVIAVRNEVGDTQRNFVEFNFNNNYSQLPSDINRCKRKLNSESNIKQMKQYFPPKRFYKRNAWESNLPMIKQVETTLLEYGFIPSMIKSSILTNEKNEDEETKRTEELKQTLKGMTKSQENAGVDGDVITSFVSKNADTILTNQNIFDDQGNQLTEYTEDDVKEQHEANLKRLKTKLNNVKSEEQKLASISKELDSKLDSYRLSLQNIVEENDNISLKIEESNEIIDQTSHTEEIAHVMKLVEEHRRNVDLFKQSIRSEKADLEQKIRDLENSEDGQMLSKFDKLTKALENAEQEWKQKRVLVGSTARKLHNLRTEYDSYPMMSELTQYRRRMSELSTFQYTKRVEQEKCNQLLNALIDTEETLQNENNLFNGILDAFRTACQQKNNRIPFLEDVRKNLSRIRENVQQVESHLNKEKDELSVLDEKYRNLLEQQRRYFQAIKEYQEAQEELESLSSSN